MKDKDLPKETGLAATRTEFITQWGALGSQWGINRTMAEIHALLMTAPGPMSTDEVMEELKISRGNANMNVRALIDWGLVHKELKPGERKEYFSAEKDMWEVAKQIIIHRKKKELEPMVKVLNELDGMKGECPESNEFCRMVRELKLYSEKADSSLEAILESKNNWLLQSYMKMLR